MKHVMPLLLAGCMGSVPAGDGRDASMPPPGVDGGGGGDAPAASDLDEFIAEQLEAGHKPGLSAAVIRDGTVVWTGFYGAADVASATPVTADTMFEVASVSKTLTVTALMQLYEAGRFQLDDDVNDHLPFSVRNPSQPDTPITFRHILTHTSSIADDWEVVDQLTVENADCPTPLADFLAGYLAPGGATYEAAHYHAEYGPGEGWDYSNVAIGLAGYLVERISGQPFDAYTEAEILAPLGMTTSTWRIAELTGSEATPHWFEGGYQAAPHLGYPDYPAGHLYTTAPELARFLAAFIRGGELDGVRILEEATVEEMRRVQLPALEPAQGLVWYYKDGGSLLGHNGGDLGWAAEMFYRPGDGTGVIMLMNGNWGLTPADDAPIFEIETRLFQVAESL